MSSRTCGRGHVKMSDQTQSNHLNSDVGAMDYRCCVAYGLTVFEPQSPITDSEAAGSRE
jgi:hypothetical protein